MAHSQTPCSPLPAGLALPERGCSTSLASDYCRRLAEAHYENFTVASWLLPPALRPHFYHVYAYCRWADDLADETNDPARSLDLLDGWEQELDACYAGRPEHPVFIALAGTIAEFDIPRHLFADLLIAFRRDQQTFRHATVDELMDYCRYSANPVGRLVLCLARSHAPETGELSDSICTGLQWANFCQDVAGDWQRGRVYLPGESWQAAGYTEAMFARREDNAAFRRALRGEVDRAENFLQRGWPLVGHVPRELRFDIALFILGGLSAVAAVRAVDYNVWAGRPRVGKFKKMRLVFQAWRESRGAPAAVSSGGARATLGSRGARDTTGDRRATERTSSSQREADA